jgi:hypothetical protein
MRILNFVKPDIDPGTLYGYHLRPYLLYLAAVFSATVLCMVGCGLCTAFVLLLELVCLYILCCLRLRQRLPPLFAGLLFGANGTATGRGHSAFLVPVAEGAFDNAHNGSMVRNVCEQNFVQQKDCASQ